MSFTRSSGEEGKAQKENCFRLALRVERSWSFPNVITKGLQEIPFRNISFQYSADPSFKDKRHIFIAAVSFPLAYYAKNL